MTRLVGQKRYVTWNRLHLRLLRVALFAASLALATDGQTEDPYPVIPENPLAAPFIKQAKEWIDKGGGELFKEYEWNAQPAVGSGIRRYRLYVPPNHSDTSRLPLLVWLNGYGEGGTDNYKHITYINELLFDGGKLPPFCILAVQSPMGTWPREQSPKRDDPLAVVEGIIDHVLTHHPADEDAIVLAGVSSGGNACWDFSCRCPDRFAAICPLASAGGNIALAKKLKDVAIWCFHSSNDMEPAPDRARTMVDAVVASGGRARFTETPRNEGNPHDCWHAAFRDYGLADWIASQRKHRTTALARTKIAALDSVEYVADYFRAPVAGSRIWWYALAALAALVVLRSTIRRRRRVAADSRVISHADSR